LFFNKKIKGDKKGWTTNCTYTFLFFYHKIKKDNNVNCVCAVNDAIDIINRMSKEVQIEWEEKNY